MANGFCHKQEEGRCPFWHEGAEQEEDQADAEPVAQAVTPPTIAHPMQDVAVLPLALAAANRVLGGASVVLHAARPKSAQPK